MSRSTEEKYRTVIDRNTFYFSNRTFEEQYEGHLNSIKETLLVLKNEISTNGLRKELLEQLLEHNDNGLKALLTLTGFSNESLKRLITLVRIVDDDMLSTLCNKDQWHEQTDDESISEWSDIKIKNMIRDNPYFREGIINIFFKGATVPFLSRTLPLFELKKLGIQKLNFDIQAMIDTLVRYKEKGSYGGKRERNAEKVIQNILAELDVSFDSGDLDKLSEKAPDTKRTMDFIIPNKQEPRIIIECSYLVTTSSGQGDKSKTEIAVKSLIMHHYPRAHFIGFVDGIGWYVRKNDLKRMVTAYEDVYTFHQDEIERFRKFVSEEIN